MSDVSHGLAATLAERLRFISDWYRGMISETTGRLAYTYDPDRDLITADGSAIRDIASVWDVELLGRFLTCSEFVPLIERSLRYYGGWLVARYGALMFDPARLGEPAGIAHSAFMMLALLDSELPGCAPKIAALAEGIMRQQRPDGSYRIYFGDEADSGLEFYPGEAMLALMRAYERGRDGSLLASVERGFEHYRVRFPANAVPAELLVFHANWQSQYAALLHEHSTAEATRRAAGDYVFGLHDRIVAGGFYRDVERHPYQRATVEVACALEGLNDAWTIAARERDEGHAHRYEQCVRVAVAWLLRAQRLERCTPRERGGFGHSMTSRTQRIDVTGHVAGGFIKTVRNGIDA